MTLLFPNLSLKTPKLNTFGPKFKDFHFLHLLNLIGGNLEITMKGIKSIKTEVTDLKKSIEFTENVLEEKVHKYQEKAEHLDERIREIYEWQLDPEYGHNKLVDLEGCSRRNNLRIDGIKKKAGESWEDSEAEVEKPFWEKLDIENKIIRERTHRAKKIKNSKKKSVKDNHLSSAKF